MRNMTWLGLICAIGATSALAACSDDGEESTSGGSTTTTTVSSTTSSTSSGGGEGGGSTSSGGDGGMGGMSGAGGSGGSAAELLNGCDPATAEEHLNEDVVIEFAVGGFKYSPACLKISQGHSVAFTPVSPSTFASHPLLGGKVTADVAMSDPGSPIVSTDSGSAPVTVVFNDIGEYGYYCTQHFSSGMMGAVFVVQ